MVGSLAVVGAGAGSGKTTKICEIVADRIVHGLDPSLVLATTFTRKAAAEMKGRIQAALLAESSLTTEERIRMSERLELAAIGTVHSVGHTLLRKYAIPLGLSPRLEVMEESGKTRHLKRLLAQSAPAEWDSLDRVARRLGHSNTHELVLTLLDAKRGNNIPDDAFGAQLKAGGARLCELLLLPAGETEEGSLDDIYELARGALEAIRDVPDVTKTTKGTVETLAKLIGSKSGRWQDCILLKKLTAGKRSGADNCLADLREAAARVRRFKGLHDDIAEFVRLLTDRALQLDREYRSYKKERGLLDFTDLEVLLLDLLNRDDLAPTLKADFELVLVDEFQDTNPIQLAIFESLRRLATESVWVGDEKQAIYGFRGTDSRLMRQVWALTPQDCRENLPKNYRSQAGLVEIVGELFTPLFGEEARLLPHHDPEPRGMERWLLHVKNNDQEAATLAEGIETLRAEGTSARDIAILTRTNNRALTYADALTTAGIPVSLSLPGLLLTREGALLLAGLRLVADRRDSLAAALILHLLSDPEAATPAWIEERLAAVRAEGGSTPAFPWDGHEILEPLRAIDARALPPLDAVVAVMDALDLSERISSFGDPSRRAQNLDALCGLARDYEEGSKEMGTAATLTGLITTLEQSADQKEDHQPAPRGTDAVTIMTYHGAKGLQWPVVVLTDLNQGRDPDLWKPTPCGGKVEAGEPLTDREIRFWPWPLGYTTGQFSQRIRGSGLQADALASPEGVAAIDLDLEESARLLYVGFTRARHKVVLAHRPGKCKWLELLPGLEEVFGGAGEPGEFPREEFSTSLVIKRFSPAEEEPSQSAPTAYSWRRTTDRVDGDFPGRLRPPSSAPPQEVGISVHTEKLPGVHPFPARIRPEKETELGLAVHAYLASLPALREATPAEKSRTAARCLRSFGVEGEVMPEALVAAGDRFTQWVDARYPEATWLTEVPTVGTHPDGGSWAGSIDLLLQIDENRVVVIDHKSTPIPESIWPRHARKHSGQLAAYRAALESAGLAVEKLWIHFPLGGGMAGVEAT